jgi:hydrogenase maturation factor HypF (carbamoyltransferase family)
VALSGGVFQNALLLERVADGLEAAHFGVLTHTALPRTTAASASAGRGRSARDRLRRG